MMELSGRQRLAPEPPPLPPPTAGAIRRLMGRLVILYGHMGRPVLSLRCDHPVTGGELYIPWRFEWPVSTDPIGSTSRLGKFALKISIAPEHLEESQATHSEATAQFALWRAEHPAKPQDSTPSIPELKGPFVSKIQVSSAKLAFPFRAGELPRINPQNPVFTVEFGSLNIEVKINAKAARKLATHQGGAVLQGRLVQENGRFQLLDAGFTWMDPKPTENAPAG
ncbi:MAG: hypothetical protein JO161_10945 [Planctomycetaceae bacterium]|nr:hypothetical protein [Planctomycetaceae bacterium]